AGQFCWYMGKYGQARTYLQDSLAIALSIDHPARIAAALLSLGLSARAGGDLVEAESCFLEALALNRALGAKRNIGSTASQLATVRRLQGDLDAAQALYDELATIARELEDQDSLAIALLNLAIIAVERRQPANARALLLEACGIATTAQSKALGQSAVEITAALAASLGQARIAGRLFGAAEELSTLSGMKRDAADEAFVRRHIDGIGTKAPTEMRSAEAQGRLVEYEEALREVCDYLALLEGEQAGGASREVH